MAITKGQATLIDADNQHLFDSGKWYCNLKGPSGRKKPYVLGTFESGRKPKLVYLHRIITECPPGLVVDHINGDPLDNRRENLRICTVQGNNRNQRVWKNAYKGVYRIKPRTPNARTRWLAQLTVTKDGKESHIRLGRYATPEEAAVAYNLGAIKYFGEYVCLNDIQP